MENWGEKRTFTMKNHRKTVHDTCFLRNHLFGVSNSLLSCSKDKTVRLWDIEMGKEVTCFDGHTGDVNCLQVLGQDIVLSASSDGTIKWWDMRAYDPIYTFLDHERHGCINTIFADPFRIVSGHTTGSIVVHEFWTQRK